jgi:hypothetical protein
MTLVAIAVLPLNTSWEPLSTNVPLTVAAMVSSWMLKASSLAPITTAPLDTN